MGKNNKVNLRTKKMKLSYIVLGLCTLPLLLVFLFSIQTQSAEEQRATRMLVTKDMNTVKGIVQKQALIISELTNSVNELKNSVEQENKAISNIPSNINTNLAKRDEASSGDNRSSGINRGSGGINLDTGSNLPSMDPLNVAIGITHEWVQYGFKVGKSELSQPIQILRTMVDKKSENLTAYLLLALLEMQVNPRGLEQITSILSKGDQYTKSTRDRALIKMYWGLALELSEKREEAKRMHAEGVALDKELEEDYFALPLIYNDNTVHVMYPGAHLDVATAMRDFLLAHEIGRFFGSGNPFFEWVHLDASAPKVLQDNHFLIIRGAFQPFVNRALAKQYHALIDQGTLRLTKPGDRQDGVAGRYVAYNDRCARWIHNQYRKTVAFLGNHKRIDMTYTYFAGYIEGANLYPHTDRKECTYTFSVQIDMDPFYHTWGLALNVKGREVDANTPGNPHASKPDNPDDIATAHLAPGDGLIFKGRRHTHWRDGDLPKGMKSLHVFLHFQPDTGPE